MINLQYVKENYRKCSSLYEHFLHTECADIDSHSSIIYFLDTHKLWISIISGDSGNDWLVEMNSIILNCLNSRIDAEIFSIKEAFTILEKTIII